MTEYFENLRYNADHIKNKIGYEPKAALVLGSGLGELANEDRSAVSVPYSELKGFPVSTVSGHNGRFVFTKFGDVPTVIMQGRVHYYEGYSMNEVVMPIRLMKLLGANKILLTNAAGGLHSEWDAGTLMMITDHISSFVPSPLIGENIDALGVRFPDMSEVYSNDIQRIITESAEAERINIRKGVYLQTSGPNYETPSEVKMFKSLGADAVGMSTACEAMAAVHCGMKVGGISCITNKAAGINSKPLTHEEVKEAAEKVSDEFKRLVKRTISSFQEA